MSSGSKTMTAQEKLYSVDDLWRLSHEPGDRRFELVKGQLVEMSPAGGIHGDIASELNMHIRLFVKQHNLGYVSAAETGYILFTDPDEGDTVRAPDVAFVQKERLPRGFPAGYIPLAPDLAVEVVSPNDKAGEIEEKIADYLRAGVRLAWFVYPKSKSVHVYTSETIERLNTDDTLDGRDVLPGFQLVVRNLFQS
jgi:Uma2 family endonuclease